MFKFNTFIQEILDERGWNADTLAKRSNIRLNIVREILEWNKIPSIDWLAPRLAKAFMKPNEDINALTTYWKSLYKLSDKN
jgi:predicted transcriptional regulator